jgi:hypothetical protein
VSEEDAGQDKAADIAAALAGAPVEALTRVGGGRNSRVFRADTARGTFALKQYPSRQDDPRDRQGVEAAALSWMGAHGLDMVPALVATDRDHNYSLLSWAEGDLVRTVRPGDIDQAADFLGRLHALRRTATFPTTHLATEACLSGTEIERQLRQRASHLCALAGEDTLHAFMRDEFGPLLEDRVAFARGEIAAAGLAFDAELPQQGRSLAPSDFGFHNALRAADGQLTFIDFEYFGWDDPVKLTADILLHPGTPVEPALRERFRGHAVALYGEDPHFGARLRAYYPLFGLRWALILLNEFHPERWRRRILAGAKESWAEAKERQLGVAREMLLNVAA